MDRPTANDAPRPETDGRDDRDPDEVPEVEKFPHAHGDPAETGRRDSTDDDPDAR